MPTFLTTEEAAAILRVCPLTLYTYIKDKRLKAYKLGRDWRITPEDLHAFLKTLQNK